MPIFNAPLSAQARARCRTLALGLGFGAAACVLIACLAVGQSQAMTELMLIGGLALAGVACALQLRGAEMRQKDLAEAPPPARRGEYDLVDPSSLMTDRSA